MLRRATVAIAIAVWKLPDTKDCVSLMNIYQSPETRAVCYKAAAKVAKTTAAK